MAGDPAELAYGHALVMLGDPDAASDVATLALRRAGRSRSVVLAHARAEAVTRAANDTPLDLAAIQIVVLDLPALAATLASTRPPEERAALDLRVRTAGDLAALGVALGSRPTVAADRCNEIAEAWERTLDPALLAFSGPGDCEGLAGVLGSESLDTVADLVAIAPAVHAHTQNCTLCTDRVRAMASVRSFFSDTQGDAPPPVRAAGRVSRTKRPSAEPPPLFATDAAGARPRRVVTARRVTVALLVLVAAGGGAAYAAARDSSTGVLARLTRLPKSNALSFGQPEVAGQVAYVELHNPTARAIRYRATASAEWANVVRASGSIPAHSSKSLVVRALDNAPEGTDRATVTVTTSSGASAEQELTWTLEHPPDIDASATGCTVNVNVVEEGKLTSFVLHWRDTAEHEVDITTGPDGYNAELTPNGAPITFWVTAVDDRGNQSRTADQTIAADAC